MADAVTAGLGLTAGVVLVLAGLTIGVRHRWSGGASSLAATIALLGAAGVAFGLQETWQTAHVLRSLFLLASGIASLAFAANVERPPRELITVVLAAALSAAAVVVTAEGHGTPGTDTLSVAVVLLAWGPSVAWASLVLYRRARGWRSLQAFRMKSLATGLVLSVAAAVVWLLTGLLPVSSEAALRVIVMGEIAALLGVAALALPPHSMRTWMSRATATVERDVLRGLLSLPEGEVLYDHILRLALELAGVSGGCIALDDGTVLARSDGTDLAVDPNDWVGQGEVVRRGLDAKRELRLYPFGLGEREAVLALEILRPAVTFAVHDSHRVARFVRTAAPYAERSLLHDQLRIERARQQAVMEAVGSLGQGYMITERGRMVEVSDTIERITGATREELLALSDAVSLIRTVDRERVRQVHRRAAVEGSVTSTTAAIEHADGSVRLVELVARRLAGEGNRLLTLVRDVTATFRALELEGRRSRQLTALTHLATSVTGVLERVSLQQAIVTATHDVLATPHVALVSRLADGRVDVVRSGPEHPDLERELPMRAVEVAAGEWASGTLATRNGVASIALISAGVLEGVLLFVTDRDPAPIDDLDRTVIEHLASLCAHGLAAARRYEGEVGARARVEASHEFQAGLLAVVAHDLRTPMHLIGGLCETLMAHGERLGPERQRDLLERLRRAIVGTERLLEDLLDVERDALGLLEVETHPVELAAFLDRLIERLPEGLRGRLVVQVPDGTRAVLDPHRAERIVENLVLNAAKYAPPGTPITVRVWQQDGDTVLAVEDEGAGIPESERDTIFEAFQRLPGASARATGVGLGLYVVSVLSRAQGATVSVSERDGGGASFRVAFPSTASVMSG